MSLIAQLAIAIPSALLASLSILILASKEIDRRVDKRIKEEFAPYREFLDAAVKSTKRSPEEVIGSGMRYIGNIDQSKLTVANLPKHEEKS